MKMNCVVAGLLVAGFAFSASVSAGEKKSAMDWQKNSLNGITSIKYGVAYDPTKSITKAVAASLSEIKIPTKAVNLKDDQSLASNEGLVKVYADDRKDGSGIWVGLSVEQKSQLERNPKITYEAETYAVGKLVKTNKDVDAAVKDVCSQFVADFNPAK